MWFAKSRKNTVRCKYCGKPKEAGSPCGYCGQSEAMMPSEPDTSARCSKCGTFLGDGTYCGICGTARSVGQYSPSDNIPTTIYGPPPVRKRPQPKLFDPSRNMVQDIYGPPPVPEKPKPKPFDPSKNMMYPVYGSPITIRYSCRTCGYRWSKTTIGKHSPQGSCPKCGSSTII